MDALRGRCLCGAIEVSLVPPLDFVSHCHCESCRRSHGAAFVTWTSVPTERFTLVDPDAQLRWHASSQWIEWGFCGRCGSSMLYRATAEGHAESPKVDRMYVTAASLDGSLDRAPQAHVSYEERVPWLVHDDGVPKYRGKTSERCD
jgi:hypothetical protein